jgi:hypothetical protein
MKDVVLSPAEEFQVFQEAFQQMQLWKVQVDKLSVRLLRLQKEKRLNKFLYVDSMKRVYVDPVSAEYQRVWNQRDRLRERIMEKIG